MNDEKVDIRYSKCLELLPFGDKFINKKSLEQGKIRLYVNGKCMMKYRNQEILNDSIDFIKNLLKNSKQNNKLHDKLSKDEKNFLIDLLKYCSIEPLYEKEREINNDYKQFKITLGELEAGNDSIELIKSLKKLLIKLHSEGSITQKELSKVLYEIMILDI